MTPLACKPAIHDHRCDLPPLARTGPVAEEKALTVGLAVLGQFQRGGFLTDFELARQVARECLRSVDQCLALRFGQKAVGLPTCGKARANVRLGRRDRTHGDRFHKRGGMDRRILERDTTRPVGQVDAGLFGYRRRFG